VDQLQLLFINTFSIPVKLRFRDELHETWSTTDIFSYSLWNRLESVN